jgi:hypothetical protein
VAPFQRAAKRSVRKMNKLMVKKDTNKKKAIIIAHESCQFSSLLSLKTFHA